MRVLLTGATGFIGSHVLKQLLDEGHDITILVRNSNKIPVLHSFPNIKIVQCNMHDYGIVDEHVKGKDALIHIALDYSEGAYNMLVHDTEASVYLFESAAKAGIKQIIYTSSTATVDYVYMQQNGRDQFAGKRIDELHRPMPTTFYGATKASCEQFLSAISYTYRCRADIIRPGYVFGNPAFADAPMQPDSRFRELVKACLNGDNIELDKNDGTQFLWAPDIAKVYARILEANSMPTTYFALGTQYITWEDITRLLVKKTRSQSSIIVKDSGIPDRPVHFDVSEMSRSLGLSFSDGFDKIALHLDYLISLAD